jgi:hypothetical protein
MTTEQRHALLISIADRQAGITDGHGTAPVTIRIGYVSPSNTVRDDGIEILDCPPAILTMIMADTADCAPSVFVDVTNGAVRIY